MCSHPTTLIYNTVFFVQLPNLLKHTENLKFRIVTIEIMNPDSGTDDKSGKNRRTKTSAAIPVAGILVAAALLSFIGSSSYQPALSQQDLTGDTTTTPTTNTNATTGDGSQASACAPTQTGGAGGSETATEAGTAGDTITGGGITTGGGGDAIMDTTNATTAGEGGVNQSTTSEVRLHIEEACMALQAGDTQGVLMHLNLALNTLGDGAQGNMTASATTEGLETSAGGGGTSEAGTAGDEPGTTEDEPETAGSDTVS